LAAAGGNYVGTVLRDALVIPVDAPALLLSTNSVSVNPNGYTTFAIHLDTHPSAATTGM